MLYEKLTGKFFFFWWVGIGERLMVSSNFSFTFDLQSKNPRTLFYIYFIFGFYNTALRSILTLEEFFIVFLDINNSSCTSY